MLDHLLERIIFFENESANLTVHGGCEYNLLCAHEHVVYVCDWASMRYLAVNCLLGEHDCQVVLVVWSSDRREYGVRHLIE